MADDIIPPPVQNGGTGSVQVPGVRAPDYRQVQAPEEVDVRRIDQTASEAGSEAEARAAQLSRLFSDFEDTSAGIGSKLAYRAGSQAGAAAGAAGNGAPKTGLQAVTAYGQGYDAAVHQTYVTQAQLGLEQTLTRIESQTQGDPNAFQTQAAGAVRGALKGMDPIYQPEMQLWAQARVQAGVNRQRDQAANDARNMALATYQSSTPDLITSALHTAAALPGPRGDAVITKLVSDDQDRLNALVASRTISPEQAVTLHQKMVADTHTQMSGQKVDFSLQPILQTMRSNVEASDKLIVQPDANLSPDENAIRLHEYEQERQQYVQAQTHAYADQLGAVHQQLAAGQFGQGVESTLHGLYKAGALSQEGLYSALAESLRNQKKQIGDEADMTLVDQIVRGEHPGPLDPDNKAQSHAVDLYFQQHVAQSGAVSPDQYAAGAAEVTRQTGILPASVASRIRVGLLSGDPQRTATASALAARIEAVNPNADPFGKSKRLAALSHLVNDNMAAGLDPTSSFQLAKAITDIPPEQRKIRDASYAQALKAQGPNAIALQKQLDHEAGMFGTRVPAPVSMQAEFDGLTHEYYDQTGNIQQARTLAVSQLRKTWGVSTVNGQPELMKWPISAALVPTVRADIASSVKSAGYNGDPSAIHLTPNAETDASGGRVWSLVHTDQNGLSDVLLDKNNRPLVYHVPSGPDFLKARQALIEQNLTQARQLRDAQRQNSSDQIMFEQQLSNEILHGNRMAGR